MNLQFVYGNPIGKLKKIKKKSIAKKNKKDNNKKVNKNAEATVAKKKAKKKVSKKKPTFKKHGLAKKTTAKKVTKKVTKKAKRVKRKSHKKAKSGLTKAQSSIKSLMATGHKKKKVRKHKTRKIRRKAKKSYRGPKHRFAVTLKGKTKEGKSTKTTVKYPRHSSVLQVQKASAFYKEKASVLKRNKKGKKLAKRFKKQAKRFTKFSKKLHAAEIFGKGKVKSVRAAMKADGVKPIRTIKKFTNPFFGGNMLANLKKYTGHETKELAGLAAGGAIYGAVNSLTAKYAAPVHAALVKVPVVGTSLPSLLAGIGLIILADKVKQAAPAAIVGKGLIAASVVGMGVQAAQSIPVLSTLNGADFGAIDMASGHDFGSADFGNAGQMGGIDYTMNGVDYTPTMGEDELDGLPEGMSGGQMG